MRMLTPKLAQLLMKLGSAQESDGDGILGCFLEYHEFRPGYGHPLGFQQ
jgi:hypothetical protein